MTNYRFSSKNIYELVDKKTLIGSKVDLNVIDNLTDCRVLKEIVTVINLINEIPYIKRVQINSDIAP